MRDPLFPVLQLRMRRDIFVSRRLFAQRAKFGAQTVQRFRRRRGLVHPAPLSQPSLESRPLPLLLVLAIEARLQALAGRVRACKAGSVVTDLQRLPAAIELDHGADNRARRGRQHFQLHQDRVRFGLPACTIHDRLEPLPREPSHAVILVLGGVGERAQALRRSYALRGGHPRSRMFSGNRDLYQRGLVAERGDRDAATFRVLRAAHHVGSDCVGALVGFQQRRCRLAFVAFRQARTQRCREGSAHCRIGFRLPGRGKCGDIRAAPGSCRADLRRWIVRQKSGKLVRVRRQPRRAEHPLRGVGVFVQGGAKYSLGDHGEA